MTYWLVPALLLLSLSSRAQAQNPPQSAAPAPLGPGQPGPAASPTASSDAPANGFADQGWTYEHIAQPELLDKQGGFLRFRVGIAATGHIALVEKVAGDMSDKQTRYCQRLIREQFTVRRTRPDAGAATGYFTFRFRVE